MFTTSISADLRPTSSELDLGLFMSGLFMFTKHSNFRFGALLLAGMVFVGSGSAGLKIADFHLFMSTISIVTFLLLN